MEKEEGAAADAAAAAALAVLPLLLQPMACGPLLYKDALFSSSNANLPLAGPPLVALLLTAHPLMPSPRLPPPLSGCAFNATQGQEAALPSECAHALLALGLAHRLGVLLPDTNNDGKAGGVGSEGGGSADNSSRVSGGSSSSAVGSSSSSGGTVHAPRPPRRSAAPLTYSAAVAVADAFGAASVPLLPQLSAHHLTLLLLGFSYLGLNPSRDWLTLLECALLPRVGRMTGWHASSCVHAFALLGYKVWGGLGWVVVILSVAVLEDAA